MLPLHARDSPASPAALNRCGGFFPRKWDTRGSAARCNSVAEPLHFRVRRLPSRDFLSQAPPPPATPLCRSAQTLLSRLLHGCVSAQACLTWRSRPEDCFRRVFPGVQEPGSTDLGPTSVMGSGCRIECIFFSEFHPTLGPKITYQVPSRLAGPGAGVVGVVGEGRSRELSKLPGSGGFPCPMLHSGIPFLYSRRIVNRENTQTQVPGSRCDGADIP